jgi:hypothetical protein
MKDSKFKIRLAAFCILNFAFCIAVSWADPLAESQARFARVTGTVRVLAQGQPKWLDAHEDLPLDSGDQIEVGDDGEAELSITKNALWVATANTDLIVEHTTTEEGRLILSRGTLFGKVEKMNPAAQHWEFETPVAVCAVRGTEFVLDHSQKGGTHLGVFKGAVEMSAAETATQSYSPVVILDRQEAALQKGARVKIGRSWSPWMQMHFQQFQHVAQRFHQIRQTWTPLTASYRLELRRKFIPQAQRRERPHFVPRRARTY